MHVSVCTCVCMSTYAAAVDRFGMLFISIWQRFHYGTGSHIKEYTEENCQVTTRHHLSSHHPSCTRIELSRLSFFTAALASPHSGEAVSGSFLLCSDHVGLPRASSSVCRSVFPSRLLQGNQLPIVKRES